MAAHKHNAMIRGTGMAKRKQNTLKATLWTNTRRVNLEGPLHAGICECFSYIKDREKREWMLARMTKIHEAKCAREDRAKRAEENAPPKHDLYQTGDEGAPEAILDSNGYVALGLCRRCGRAEVELNEPCEVKESL